MAQMVVEGNRCAASSGWEVARRASSQLMTYRSLFVVARGQNASDRPTSSAAAGETTAERMIMGSCAKLA